MTDNDHLSQLVKQAAHRFQVRDKKELLNVHIDFRQTSLSFATKMI